MSHQLNDKWQAQVEEGLKASCKTSRLWSRPGNSNEWRDPAADKTTYGHLDTESPPCDTFHRAGQNTTGQHAARSQFQRRQP